MVAFLSAGRQLGNLQRAFEADPPPPGVVFHPVLPLLKGQGITTRAIADVFSAFRGLRDALVVKDVDVVVASAPMLITIPLGWLVAKVKRRPFVLDLRDAWPELMADWREWNDDGHGPRRRAPLKRLIFPAAAAIVDTQLRWLRAQADAVIVTTDGLAKRLREDGLRRVEVVRNTCTKPWAYALARVPETSDRLNVLYLGNVGRAQLLATAIKAAALASRQGTELTLRVVGSGPQWAAARRIARELDAPVEFIDRIPTYAVLDHYRWADTILVILRSWDALRETVPSKLYEALVTGKHVTASVDGETADLVRTYSAGDVVPVEDAEALATLWVDLAANRHRLHVPHSGRYWVRKHLSPEALSRSFEGVLKDVTRANAMSIKTAAAAPGATAVSRTGEPAHDQGSTPGWASTPASAATQSAPSTERADRVRDTTRA